MNSDPLDPNSNKCLQQFADGRTCRMLRKKGHPSFCIHHAREEQQCLESEKLAAEFASLSGKLNTVTDINHVLGKVFIALAEKRISHQTAETFGYLGQLSSSSSPYPASKANSTPPCSIPAPTMPCCATTSLFPPASENKKEKIRLQPLKNVQIKKK